MVATQLQVDTTLVHYMYVYGAILSQYYCAS